ncbi:putative membrane protein insertion efficiency factor [Legionella waltersii]|uniref:Putative membrane protein insertion efficiency factor n=2 Tax=Legionella waltersii TaxID=66969 RepID=A0A0W1A554_9GAMM|nr:putative membrane protein insertion efficiency factor [Legionella waltersii]SNV14732.1 Protein YidD [Legionella waltersii]
MLQQIVCLPIKMYQYFISPMISPCCRFHPSCSDYMQGAINHYGVCKGLWMGSKRLLKCHPWAEGGFDPIIPKEEKF